MFKNEAFTDFSDETNKSAYFKAMEFWTKAHTTNALYACPIIDGDEVRTQNRIDSFDPSTGLPLGDVFLASVDDATKAINSVRKGSNAWEQCPVEKRAQCLRTIASTMRERKTALSALITLEEGKPWSEADGDVAEAIDFCEYYALEMLRLSKPIKTEELKDEDNFYFYQPRGSVVVISPWNFPLAITAGMTVAALVTGNTTILKPARQSSLIAHEFAKIVLKSGIPSNAFAFLPSPGGQVGAFLASHPEIDMICFTGSMEVGLDLIKTAGIVKPGQRNVKKVIAEMGGKNAMIIDSDAEIESAVKAAIVSAFGFAGQKCSALSRLIVVGDKYETFLAKFCEAAAKIKVGLASDPDTFMGPVIDEASQKRILSTIREAENSISVAYKGECPSQGYFVPPTIFRDVPQDAFIWQEEIFGPVVACCKVESFEEAIKKANSCAYALTGGVFSKNKEHLDLAKRDFKVGNLYLNRKITGALVCRQPFGGFRMSGIGSKAGG
ncbi:MAG: aldehyde dehydrogenase family protein, partial [SAR324 cluster bacterium]|nr:aldehyde dehydrogenase family protein [SAR324 cluster bacterium]